MIEVSGLTKDYKKKRAVDNLSFTVETGKVTGFLGPNGAGKSTTMRMMVGLDTGAGKTTFGGKPLQSYADPAKIIGILLEAKAFHPTRTASNHLKILAAAGGIPDKRVAEVLDIVGLSDVANKKPGKFSMGMSQRLGIAAALLGKPKYLMLDEPSNGLDPEGIAWLRQFIKDYADEGNAVFLSSHLLSDMAQMADNVVVIGKGKLIISTSVDQLTSSGTNAYTFVRSSDTAGLEATLKALGKPFKAQNDGFSIPGVKTDIVGKAAFKDKVPVLELTEHGATLEDAFLELTADAEEYRAGGKAKPS